MKAAFLTAEQVGPGFTGGTPSEDSQIAEASEPVCDVKLPQADEELIANFLNGTKRSVTERIRVFADPQQAEAYIEALRMQGEAKCEYDESVGTTRYHVEVDAPIPDFPAIGLPSAGFVQSYTGGYEGKRYVMAAQVGLCTVYIEATGPDLEPGVALAVYSKAVQEAVINLPR